MARPITAQKYNNDLPGMLREVSGYRISLLSVALLINARLGRLESFPSQTTFSCWRAVRGQFV